MRPIWHDLRADPAIAHAMNRHVVVQRPTGAVSVRVDRVEQTPEGTRYIQFKSGKRGKDDHLNTRIMLYTLAAEQVQNGGKIAIHYTATDETHTIRPRPDVLERHISKIDRLVAGIATGRWEPNNGEHCATCPFNLICPV